MPDEQIGYSKYYKNPYLRIIAHLRYSLWSKTNQQGVIELVNFITHKYVHIVFLFSPTQTYINLSTHQQKRIDITDTFNHHNKELLFSTKKKNYTLRNCAPMQRLYYRTSANLFNQIVCYFCKSKSHTRVQMIYFLN